MQAQPSKSTIGNNEEMSSLSPVFMQTQNLQNMQNNNFSLSKTIDNDETMFDPDEGQQTPKIQNRRRNYEKTENFSQKTR